MTAIKKFTDNILNWVADADYSAGVLIDHPTGKVGVLNNDVVSGELCGLDIACQVELTTAAVIAAGAVVDYDNATGDGVASGSGDFAAGKAVNASANGVVLVLLNA